MDPGPDLVPDPLELVFGPEAPFLGVLAARLAVLLPSSLSSSSTDDSMRDEVGSD
jgi:hypothetical protein